MRFEVTMLLSLLVTATPMAQLRSHYLALVKNDSPEILGVGGREVNGKRKISTNERTRLFSLTDGVSAGTVIAALKFNEYLATVYTCTEFIPRIYGFRSNI